VFQKQQQSRKNEDKKKKKMFEKEEWHFKIKSQKDLILLTISFLNIALFFLN